MLRLIHQLYWKTDNVICSVYKHSTPKYSLAMMNNQITMKTQTMICRHSTRLNPMATSSDVTIVNGQFKANVDGFKAGTYIFSLDYSNGTKSQFKVVVSK